jgi:hypothetical protein
MPPILSYRVERYEHEGPLLRIKLTIVFQDNSCLHVKEYRFGDGSRKYAYHWVAASGTMLVRWDNAEHWPEIPTFPHHKHIASDSEVKPSTETGLEAVLKVIAASLAK